MRPTGGVIGGVSAFEIGNEHQQHGTPHGHGQAHVVCIYQYTTLRAIAEEIEKAWNGIEFRLLSNMPPAEVTLR